MRLYAALLYYQAMLRPISACICAPRDFRQNMRWLGQLLWEPKDLGWRGGQKEAIERSFTRDFLVAIGASDIQRMGILAS